MNCFNYKIIKENISKNGFSRYREWLINECKLISPTIFLGVDPFSKPFPWKEKMEVPGIFINILNLLKSDRFNKNYYEGKFKSLHGYLDFSGTIFADSGGFKLLNIYSKKEAQELYPKKKMLEKFIGYYKILNPNFITIPDFPYDPYIDIENNFIRFKKNYFLIQEFLKKQQLLKNSLLVPVIHPFPHSYYQKQILRTFRKQKEKSLPMKSLEGSPIIGIGGLIPYFLKGGGRSHMNLEKILDFICFVRLNNPDKFIHVFGLGSTSIMPILFFLGIDSVDTMGWRIRAAYNKIQFSGTGDYSIFGTNGWSSKSVYDDKLAKRLILECECPACRKIRENNWDIGYFQLKENATISFKLRAIHNAYTYLEGAKNIRKIIKNHGDVEKYIDNMLCNNPRALKMFHCAKKIVERYKISKNFGWL